MPRCRSSLWHPLPRVAISQHLHLALQEQVAGGASVILDGPEDNFTPSASRSVAVGSALLIRFLALNHALEHLNKRQTCLCFLLSQQRGNVVDHLCEGKIGRGMGHDLVGGDAVHRIALSLPALTDADRSGRPSRNRQPWHLAFPYVVDGIFQESHEPSLKRIAFEQTRPLLETAEHAAFCFAGVGLVHQHLLENVRKCGFQVVAFVNAILDQGGHCVIGETSAGAPAVLDRTS